MSTTDDFFDSQRLLIKTAALIEEAKAEERNKAVEQLLMDGAYPAGMDVHEGFNEARTFFLSQGWSFDHSTKHKPDYWGKEVLVISSPAHPSMEFTGYKREGVPMIFLRCRKLMPGQQMETIAPATKEEVAERVKLMVRHLLVTFAPTAS